ncbi:MAG TPA: LarC family nickel insertion protein [Actinomycetota bacterium]|nr:LarC family nickel insertion protein [Actinomycetota bacterium]
MRLAYFDCIAGISGDSALGALLDAGVDVDELRAHLATLPLEPFDLEIDQVDEHGVRATRVGVRTAGTAGVIRTYASVRALLDGSDLPPEALRLAQRIFRRYAEAEARVHRRDIEAVTFHDLAGLDAIVDVAGTAIGLTMFGVERVFASAVPTGLGMTRTEHGAMPIPTPTVVELLRGAPLFSRGVAAELTNAAGAAILAATVEGFGELPAVRVEIVGYGAGAAHLDFPNVTRVLIGEEEPAASLPSVPQPPELRLVPEPEPGDRDSAG